MMESPKGKDFKRTKRELSMKRANDIIISAMKRNLTATETLALFRDSRNN
jgi:hypothetical protein